jgi:3-hydroxyacyl-CoA dehydrogenase / enoyl-CoA hydratase / 3-hydroxybutyryl-CoA epimerase
VTEAKKAEVLGRITPTTDYAALKGCDLVVEAVFEDPQGQGRGHRARPRR